MTRNTFMGDYRVKQQQRACSNWTKGTVPDNYFEPLVSSIPTLVFSGYFDPVTPPSMAQQIVKTLPNSFLITISTMSHTFDGLTNPDCFDKIVVEFFNRPDTRPASECTRQMLPEPYKTKE
jgi:pimeloyl-ACP methyl ester carboxylesterase